MKKTLYLIFIVLILSFVCSCSSFTVEQKQERAEIREQARDYYKSKYGEKMGTIKEEIEIPSDHSNGEDTDYSEYVAFKNKKE